MLTLDEGLEQGERIFGSMMTGAHGSCCKLSIHIMQIEIGMLSFSFFAGVAAFFNPCGFALLPSFVSYYLASHGNDSNSSVFGLGRGISLGITVSLGFLVVFVVLGVLLSLGGTIIAQYLPWIAAFIGVALVALGVWMLPGRSVSLHVHLERFLETHMKKHHAHQGFSFFFLYGMSYALASISCTIPIFFVVVAQSFSLSPLNGIIHFVAYGIGMTVMMLVLSVAIAVSKQTISRFFPVVMRVIQPVSAVIIIGAGVYLVYYNLIYSGVLWR